MNSIPLTVALLLSTLVVGCSGADDLINFNPSPTLTQAECLKYQSSAQYNSANQICVDRANTTMKESMIWLIPSSGTSPVTVKSSSPLQYKIQFTPSFVNNYLIKVNAPAGYTWSITAPATGLLTFATKIEYDINATWDRACGVALQRPILSGCSDITTLPSGGLPSCNSVGTGGASTQFLYMSATVSFNVVANQVYTWKSIQMKMPNAQRTAFAADTNCQGSLFVESTVTGSTQTGRMRVYMNTVTPVVYYPVGISLVADPTAATTQPSTTVTPGTPSPISLATAVQPWSLMTVLAMAALFAATMC